MKKVARVEFKKTFQGSSAEREARVWGQRIKSLVKSFNRNYEIGLSDSATIREAMPRFLKYKSKVDKLKPETISVYENVLIGFAQQLSDGAGDLPLECIDQKMLDEWMIVRCESAGNSTIHREVGVLKTFGRWCMGRQLCGALPVAHCLTPRPQSPDPRFMDMSDLFELLRKIAKTHPHVALPLECMLRLGVRPAAVCALKWGKVKLPGREHSGTAWFKTLKKGEPSICEIFAGGPMHKNLKRSKRIIENRRGLDVRKSFPVYFKSKGAYSWTVKSLGRAAADAARKHGVDDFTPYVIRHSVATYLKQRGLSAVDIQHFMSHKSTKPQEKYDHTSAVDARNAFAIMQGVEVEDSSFRDVGARDVFGG